MVIVSGFQKFNNKIHMHKTSETSELIKKVSLAKDIETIYKEC